jgi:hypothetical protein
MSFSQQPKIVKHITHILSSLDEIPLGNMPVDKMSLDGTAFFTLSMMVEGTTEKVFQFRMPPKQIYNKNFSFNENFFFVLKNDQGPYSQHFIFFVS